MRGIVGGLTGGIVGFVISSAVYVSVNPVLEAAGGPVRELQGLLWNLVPLLTVAGSVTGWWLATRGRDQRGTPRRRRGGVAGPRG